MHVHFQKLVSALFIPGLVVILFASNSEMIVSPELLTALIVLCSVGIGLVLTSPRKRSDLNATSRTRPLSLHKRVLFGAVLVVLVCLAVEMISYFCFPYATQRAIPWNRVILLRNNRLDSNNQFDLQRWDATQLGSEQSFLHEEIVHPFTGYVMNPNGKTISEFGYQDPQSPIHKRSKNKLIIGILGGSLAEQFVRRAQKQFVKELRASPRFESKEIVIVNLGMSGYKQPQQLMSVAYLMSLKAEFDIILNIDGFNEVALYEAENQVISVFPAYPRKWRSRLAQEADPTRRRYIGQGVFLEFKRQRLAAEFSAFPWRHSVFFTLVWQCQDNHLKAKLDELEQQLRQYRASPQSDVNSGPKLNFDDESSLYEHMVELWINSSIQLDRLCKANGIRYFHFLQPNQYVANSKIFSSKERGIAINEHSPYMLGAERGYPLLISEGAKLAEQGVSFTDLTQIFSTTSEVIYVDDCCHLNELGNEMLASRIAEVILQASP